MDALKKKPVPEEFTEHVVKLPGQDIIFKDLTSKVKINRADILKKIKPEGKIISIPSPPALTALPSEHSSEIQDTTPDSISDSTQKSKPSSITHPPPGKTVYAPAPAKKLKKKLRLKSPTIKSTITQAQPPSAPTIKVIKRPKTAEPDQIQEGTLIDPSRLPPEERIVLKATEYYMNNRTIFSSFINNLFSDYKAQLVKESTRVSCEKDEDFRLLTHQKIVRDYINLYTPYRGLLLYHGLGSGKTCSSIAIAEGIKSSRTITVMTPASLRSNYIKELKFCGDRLYKKKQYWQFIKTNVPEMMDALAQVLSLPIGFIKKHGGCWLVNVKEGPNYDSLSSSEKKILDEQLDAMILSKYKFINYNGLRTKSFDEETQQGTINPFDNKVVIIDEAHNFISRIVNKIKQPSALSMRLYDYLLKATNCRIVLLTGTPIINYPNELGILFNILRGNITTWRLPVTISTTKKVDMSTFKKIIKKNKVLADIIDYVDYKANRKELTFTRNPFGFASVYEKDYRGVKMVGGEEVSNDRMLDELEKDLAAEKIIINKSGRMVENYRALPDSLDIFTSQFVNKNNTVKNKNLFQKRIIGLTSYFPDLTRLMPRFNKIDDIHVIKITMSDFQLKVYESARVEERKSTKNKGRPKKGINNLYQESTSTYRIFSRAYCNFVFPEGKRPKPRKGESLDESALDNLSVEEKMANVDGKFTVEDISPQEKKDQSYEKEIREAIDYLKLNSKQLLSPKGEDGHEGLQKYSPKFLEMLKTIKNPDYEGLHLVYSQFRTLEGIGIFKLVLEQNGFVEFRVMKDQNGLWKIEVEDITKPAFALYTGTEDEEQKELLRNIFNGDWETIPNNIREELEARNANNNMGEIIKVLMITSSGAEGISLRNTRYVHITEPYWHPVRIEQVIGRARRICSHTDLPVELQTVEVFIYLMTISDEQLKSASRELNVKDVGEETKRPLTSDESLYEISMRKARVNQNLLQAIKEASMDCALHSNSEHPLACYTIANPSANKFTYDPNIKKDSSDKIAKLNVKKIKWEAQEIKIKNKMGEETKYAWNKENNKVYDYDSYIQALTGLRNPEQVGIMESLGDKGWKFIPLR